MKQNHTKYVYFLFFNPLKVTGELKIESLGWVHGGKLGGGKNAMGQNQFIPWDHNSNILNTYFDISLSDTLNKTFKATYDGVFPRTP